MKFSIMDLFSKCDQFRWKLRIWSHLLKQSLIEKYNFFMQCRFFQVFLVFEHCNISTSQEKPAALEQNNPFNIYYKGLNFHLVGKFS